LFVSTPSYPIQLSGESAAARELLALSEVINQAVGDAISGILLVEAALRRRQWGLPEWATLYTDLPSRQAKVRDALLPTLKMQGVYLRTWGWGSNWPLQLLALHCLLCLLHTACCLAGPMQDCLTTGFTLGVCCAAGQGG
jgi:hypothetical protein